MQAYQPASTLAIGKVFPKEVHQLKFFMIRRSSTRTDFGSVLRASDFPNPKAEQGELTEQKRYSHKP